VNNAIICGTVPDLNGGASSSVYFKYLEEIIQISDTVELFIIVNKISDFDLKINKLIEDLNNPINLKILKLNINTTIDYLPWKKEFYLYKLFKKKLVLEKFYDNLICFDIEIGYLKLKISAKKKILWLGDLQFELEWFNYFEENQYSIYKYLKMLYLFLNKLVPYKLASSNFDKIVCCSLSAQIRLNRLGINAKFLPFPYPSICQNQNEINNLTRNRKFLFYGNLVGSGSKSGLNFLFNEILPAARKTWGINNFSIIIGGRTKLPKVYDKYLETYTEVNYIGYIPDLNSFLKQFTALLIPISLPLGNRTRVIDGFSFGIPVVGHKALSNGNPFLINEVNCLLSDTGDDFILKLDKLCTNDKVYNEIIENGKKTYDLTYNPKNNHAIQLLN
jgi:hypothetical protein